jgi:gliding motility-associated-like protein
VKFLWQSYENMTVTRYEIYVSDNNGASFVKHTELPATEMEYSYTDFQTGHYCFKMNAVHERGVEKKPQIITSCQYCLDVYVPEEPGSCFFRSVSVKDNTIQISFEVDITAMASKYQIERSETGDDDSYDIIATLAPTGSPVISFVDADPTLKTQNHTYHYLLNALDSCNKVYPAEKPAHSVLLTAIEDKDHHAILDWNNYNGYLFGLYYYAIDRYINGELDKTFFDILTPYYTDNDILLSDQTLSVDYRVAAISHAAYGIGKNERDTAFSNIATLKRLRSDIWFPNAFSPSGSNRVFRPVYSGLAVETYEFVIFDRYGAAIYQTAEPGGGWNGKINGVTAASGGYGYMLKIKLKNGDRIERRGSVLLIN